MTTKITPQNTPYRVLENFEDGTQIVEFLNVSGYSLFRYGDFVRNTRGAVRTWGRWRTAKRAVERKTR